MMRGLLSFVDPLDRILTTFFLGTISGGVFAVWLKSVVQLPLVFFASACSGVTAVLAIEFSRWYKRRYGENSK